MRPLRSLLVIAAILGMLLLMMIVQTARDRAHQQPLGFRTMGHRPR
jgi:hypothetical protein